MGMYDIPGAASGAAAQMEPEEREMQRIRRVISAAEQTNYDGDPEYYNQIKSIAMQAGIPIKQFKTNPFRLAKTFGMSMLDTALMGIVPNDLYTPMNTAEEVANVAGMAGAFALPWGAAAGARKIAVGGVGALGKSSRALLNKAMGQGNYKKVAGMGGLMGGGARKKAGTFMGGAKPKPPKATKSTKGGVKPTSKWNKSDFVTEIKKVVKAAKKQKLNLSLANQKLFANIKNLSKSQLQKLLAAARKLG